jgi:phosphoglycerate dehydrogenase-like enzyme
MKRGAVLINTSRGPIVDEDALVEALSVGWIRAGLDVFSDEPLALDHPLRRQSSAVMTPHVGYVVEETMRLFYEQTVENIVAYQQGVPLQRAV